MNKPALPLFDSLEYIEATSKALLAHPEEIAPVLPEDFRAATLFLQSYKGSQGTFNSYRREVERLLQWCGGVAHKSLVALRREDLEAFVSFCQNPPRSWIGTKKAPRFLAQDGQRVPNPEWRPFVVTISKAAHQKGERPDPKQYSLSQGAIKELFAILSTFYQYLIQEEMAHLNPVMMIRQKSKFLRKYQETPKIRRLSEQQWQMVMHTAKTLAEMDPATHMRTLFILSALYSLYLRISELTATARWVPKMCDFYRDSEGAWWFTTVGKGNKQRQIAVSDTMLEALKQWRQHLGLSPLPSLADTSPLLPKIRGKGPITNTNSVRKIVQYCFDSAVAALEHDGHAEEAASLMDATTHWLRHTGISDDVKHRPREHVRDDAGHSSSITTDKYIDIELRERYKSAKGKII